MRDWKEISKAVSERHPDATVFLESPHLPSTSLPKEAVPFYSGLSLDVEGPVLSPKQVRRFLWDHRVNRAVQRDRAFVETSYNEETDVSSMKIGTITVTPVVERISNGS
tara:strand:- start:3006 stop:3332 length:327 start_codon:yes stop_codon:yes gene_type:complete